VISYVISARVAWQLPKFEIHNVESVIIGVSFDLTLHSFLNWSILTRI